jgi:hypothetical protein
LGSDRRLDPAFPLRRLDGLVEQKGLADVLYLWYRTLQVEGLGKHNLEDLWMVSVIHGMSHDNAYLLHVDAVASAAEDETSFHRSGESLGLMCVSRMSQ